MQQDSNLPRAPARAIVKGAFVLGAAAIVSKLLGTLQKIPLQNVAGDGVFGIYNAVYPLYTLILFLATAGLPVAVSRFVAEEMTDGSADGARGVVKMALTISVGTGLFCFILLYAGAGTIASWIGNGQTEDALRSVSFALLFVPWLATLRGYFQGLGDMVPTGVSQVTEQLIRVAVMVALLFILIGMGASDGTIAAGATFGSAAGALAGLIVMAAYWYVHTRRRKRNVPGEGSVPPVRPRSGRRVSYKAFIAYALPICLGSAVLPILTLADTFTVPRLLQQGGLGEAEAMAQFGLYNHGLPLIQLVAMIVSSMSVALVPVIAAARARGTLADVRGSAEASLRLVWLIGLAASAGMAVTAIPLNVMFYKEAAGYGTMMILSFTAVFSVVQIVSGTILQGLGAERATAYFLLFAAALKIILNIWLVPRYGIAGAAVSAVAAYALAAGLSLFRLRSFGFVRLSVRTLALKPLLATAIMVVATAAVVFASDEAIAALFPGFSYRWRQTFVALISVAAGAAVFGIALFRTGALGAADLAAVPKVGAKLLPLLRKWRIVSH
ncbi:putative polysaccharide biosynthesis protein [Paenibacillus ginsengarvi]|uniref:Polysaccharide biosynthesis protein n=1 Tax=Paenibacillus ginsengarvi TaxID=400777 RepID=A0A3B0AZA3_9BACL|nr:oligosaccharide flippase family protein [Paenibacillus ginsengarvi]RKN65750.1 polysaccharide biosynthesis protein [Paenibacillus ginsengarvi]